MGRWRIGISIVLLGLVIALCSSIEEVREGNVQEVNYTSISATEIMIKLKSLEQTRSQSQSRAKCIHYLEALAQKCAIQQRQAQKKAKQKKTDANGKENACTKQEELGLICQHAVYFVLQVLYPSDDDAVAAALSLHAVVAKDPKVRQRHVNSADAYGLNVPVKAMKDALERSKAVDQPDEEKERLAAELQRKGCLLLGAIADGNQHIATRVVDEDGLEVILDAVRWYREHEDIANWSLWALFLLCYEHPGNKGELVRLGGIQTICETLQHVTDSREVARHGIAILFDGLREVRGKPYDVIKLRENAIAAGLHSVVYDAMVNFSDSVEIMMMGREMLIATGYKGEKGIMPQYIPAKKDAI